MACCWTVNSRLTFGKIETDSVAYISPEACNLPLHNPIETNMKLWNAFLLAITLASFFSLQESAAQENWPRFHGNDGSGLAESTSLPTRLSDSNYSWKIDLPGVGSSSPVIWKNRLFVTSCDAESGELTLQCLDAASGQQVWQNKFESQPYQVHARNNFASATPALDAERVYVAYANPDHTMLVALTHAGELVWKRDFGTWVSQHGFGVSPMVYDDKVVFLNSQQADQLKPGVTPGTSRIIAVNASDGTDAWTVPLTTTRACYGIPTVFRQTGSDDQLVCCNTGDGFFSLNPATGERNWVYPAFSARTVASTLVADGLVIGSCGSGGGGNYLVAIRPDSLAKDGAPQEIYKIQKANYVPSPVAINGLLFVFTDKGIGNCYDLQTGKSHWQQRLSSGFSGSPVATNDAVYVMDEEGTVFVVSASSEFEVLSKHPLGESTRSTPAVANGRIYFRTDTQLFCVE
jgi:outer membrane protein assembly factor BamB